MSCRCDPLSSEEACAELDGIPLVSCLAGALDSIKEVRDRCLAAGIPVLVGCPPGAGKG